MPKVMPRTPETEKAMEYSVPDMIMELAKKIVQDTKKGFTKKLKPGEKINITEDELLDMALAGVGGAIRIKGPKAISRAIRDQIKKELKARGEPDLKNWVDRVLRGTWVHGRSTYPKPGESYTRSRFRPGNLGEPHGMSLTAQPELLKYHFARPDPKYEYAARKLAQLNNKVDALRTTEITKDPTIQSKLRERDVVEALFNQANRANDNKEYIKLIIKRGDLSEEIQQLSQKYYDKYKPLFAKIDKAQTWLQNQRRKPPVARVMPKFGGPPAERTLLGWKASRTIPSQEVLKEVYKKALTKQPSLWDVNKSVLVPNWRNKINFAKFNQDISDELLSRGYKGLLYSPYRFEEWELRMLDPSDVMHIDMRKVDDPALHRMLGAISKDPYSATQQYGMPTGLRGRSLRSWAAMTENFPYSLRNIYQDIDLPVAGKIQGGQTPSIKIKTKPKPKIKL